MSTLLKFFVFVMILLPGFCGAQNLPSNPPYQFPEPPPGTTGFFGFFDGFYSGEVVTYSGHHVPIEFSVFMDKEVVLPPLADMWAFAKRLVGGILISGEGGPFSLCDITYDTETGNLEVKYCRPESEHPTFWLEGKLLKDHTVSGVALSNRRGQLGTFAAKRIPHQTVFSMHPFTQGTWKGTWTYPDGSTAPFTLSLADSGKSTSNPSELEFAYSPGRIGSARIGNFEIPFARIVVDYFSGQSVLTFQDASAGTVLDLVGSITANRADGRGSSSLKGYAGSFAAARVAEKP
jgi:hypothetical protein